MLDSALGYASRGWHVFPMHGVSNGQCTCGKPNCHSPAKHPIFAGWQEIATSDPAAITHWWHQRPWANIGIATGSRSGIVVLDVDISPTKNGLASLEAIEHKHGKLPTTMTVRTGSGGYHFYFAASSTPLKNSVGHLGEGLDIRAEGGLVVAPPSLHITGNRYSVENTHV
ncbi:bifunctional DNA primase/polymerase [uncultured Marivita sp.]|uniref:bifunctional DNA primase/polymerase n=1 Tax=uncultured Marivita sp. TaxID=888080 RepID=UPI00260F5EE1|nr:bifunctional DNA primase/polymerase [uncultured Marivita sp.]